MSSTKENCKNFLKVACQANFLISSTAILESSKVQIVSTKIGVIDMTWWKNGLLLAAGGVAGLALAAWLESEGKHDDYDEDVSEDRPRKRAPKADGMELLVEKVRRDAEWAMEECTTDCEREKVYEEVTASIRELQATLQKRGEKIISDLREQAMSRGNTEDLEDSTGAITQFKSSMEDLTKSLDDTLASLNPTPAGV